MGIRFYCPNGHRLNVKDFLAGKQGICPHCEARFRIPRESQLPKGAPKVKPGSAAEVAFENGSRRRAASSVGIATAPQMVGTITRAQPGENLSGVGDPIDESPDAMWYVRPPSGGQFGPARGEILRRWIAEGRVSPDTLVWREGWADWRVAGPLFPSLAPTRFLPKSLESATTAIPLAEKLPTPAPLPIAPKPTPGRKSLAYVALLILLIMVLTVVIAAVLAMKN